MLGPIRRAYYALVKPRSVYLSDVDSPFPSDKKRMVDAEKGERNGIGYRLETVVNERESPLSVSYVSKQSIQDIVKERGYNVEANLAAISEIKEKKQGSLLRQWFDQVSRGGVVNSILTRPSYQKEIKRTYLILTGLSQDDLEEVRLREAAKSRDHATLYKMALHNPQYAGTPYEVFLLGLAEERFRKIAEREAEENKKNPQLHKLGFDWQLSPEKLMLQMAVGGQSDLFSSYYLVKGKAVPVLEVNNFEQGHEAAQDCIDFFLKDGPAILQDRICLIRHRPHLIGRLDVNLVDYILGLSWVKDFYVEIAKEHLVNEDLQIAPYFGKLDNGDLEALAERLVPEVLRSCSNISVEEDKSGRIAVVSFKGYPKEGNRILCYSSRALLREYNQSRKDQVRVVADARSPGGREVSNDFNQLFNFLYNTDKRRWFEYFELSEGEQEKYPDAD